MTIVGLDHVQIAIPEDGETAARRFYGDLLGLAEVPRPAVLASRPGVWFERGDVRVHMGVDPKFHPARKAHPAFVIDDLALLVGRLTEAGFETTPAEPIAGRERAFVLDPFGNRIELMQHD